VIAGGVVLVLAHRGKEMRFVVGRETRALPVKDIGGVVHAPAAPVDCTVFEDLLVGMKSAKSVGMKVWAMHDDSSASDWPEICHLADGVLFDFHDAPRVL